MVQATKLSIDEFWIQVDRSEYEDHQLELHNGELIVMPPPKPYNSEIAAEILYHLKAYNKQHNLGRITGADGAYRLSEETLLVPDVAFIAHTRIPESYERGVSKAYEAAPNIAVEVISPTEQVRKKTRTYLDAGTQVVWNVYPEDKTVDVVRLDEEGNLIITTLTTEDTLSGGEVLPDFTLAVATIFS